MSDLINAADAIRTSIKNYKALSEYADALERAGQLEQYSGELTKSIAVLKDTEAKALAAVNVAKAKHKEYTDMTARVQASAVEEADSTIEAAKAEASKIRGAARDKAKAIEAEAEKAAAAREALAGVTVAAAGQEVTALRAEANAAIAAKAEAERKLADTVVRLDALKEKYETLFKL